MKYRLIYNKVTYPALAYFLTVRLFVNDLPFWHYTAGAVALGGITLLLAVVSDGQIGGGDIKLFAVLGAALGLKAGLSAMIASYLVAGIPALAILLLRLVNKERFGRIKHLPMAPFITAGTLITLLSS